MPRTPDPGALQYDLRADHVTRRRQPASRAFMPTLRKRLGHGRSAYAHLAGSTRIHLHQLSPGARSLVPEFGKERVPSGVVDRAGQYSARKSFDVQVFHRDQPVAFHQPTAEIMMKGGTLVSDFTVRLGHECGGLAAAVAAALATGKPALRAAQVCQPALEVSGIVDLHAIRKSDKAIQSDIHADILGRLRQRHTVSLDGKTHVPVVHVPLDRNGLDLTLHRPVQFDLDETSALDTQLPVFEPSAAIAVGWKGDTVVPPERTEAREAGLLAASYANEERLEGLIQPAEHILAAGEVGQSEQPFFPHRLQLLSLVVVVDALAANFPSIAPFLKGGVVAPARWDPAREKSVGHALFPIRKNAGDSGIPSRCTPLIGKTLENLFRGHGVIGGERELRFETLENLICHSNAHIKIQLRAPHQERVDQRTLFRSQFGSS